MLYQDSLNHAFSRLLEGVLGVKRCFIETVAKTGLFGATEYVLYRIPDNTDNRDPVYGVLRVSSASDQQAGPQGKGPNADRVGLGHTQR